MINNIAIDMTHTFDNFGKDMIAKIVKNRLNVIADAALPVL